MKIKIFFLILISFPTLRAQADDVCLPLSELKKRVQYCDENFDYYDAALVCKKEYFAEVKVEQKRISEELKKQNLLIMAGGQNEKMLESKRILDETISNIDYLSRYGKHVHTEIEDYIHDLVLPIYDEAEAKANLNDPAVKAEYMSRECYGDPNTQMNSMNLEIRKIVAELETTKAEAKKLAASTGANAADMGVITGGVKSTLPSQSQKKSSNQPSAKKRESSISGEIKPSKTQK